MKLIYVYLIAILIIQHLFILMVSPVLNKSSGSSARVEKKHKTELNHILLIFLHVISHPRETWIALYSSELVDM